MHEVEYHNVKFELPNPLNSSKYVGITDDVENAWMDIAYRTSLPLTFFPFQLTTPNSPRPTHLPHLLPRTPKALVRHARHEPQDGRNRLPRGPRSLPPTALLEFTAHEHVSRVLYESMVERYE